MAKSYITYLLKEKLGTYLEGLERTELTFGLSAHMEMANVKIKEESIQKFELPIDIKFGIIKKLRVNVPWSSISSSPVDITLQGMDLILTPKRQSDWAYSDIFSEKYLKEMILGISSKIATQIQSEKE
jgi:vacuolar protein sorting-associated protein 13A/C